MEEIPAMFRLARNVSKMSTHQKVKMGAVIVRNGKPVSVGCNQGKSHPNAPVCGLHAEANAIRYAGKTNLRGSSIFVYRERKDGKLGMARPCEDCMKVLKENGIKWIFYTTYEFPYFDCEKIRY
jgi:deoxycytidylate deaminase